MTKENSEKKEKNRNKRNKPGWNRYHLFSFFVRFFIACYFFGIYLTNRELLDISGFPKWSGLYIISGILLLDFVTRFFPLKIHPQGMKKQLKSEFIPTQAYKNNPTLTVEDLKKLKAMNKEAFRGHLLYFGICTVILVLYFIRIIGVPELFLVTLAFWVGDMVCVNLYCPFRHIMGNRCCSVCRIYNWDALYTVFPLIVVPGLLTWGLILVAAVQAFLWEIAFNTHPERFLERTNKAIQCEHCPRDLCPMRRKAFFQSLFSTKTKK